MKNKILILGIAISGLAFAQLNDQCIAFTTKGKTIWLQVVTGICGENTSKNIPCKNKTKHESGKCYHHRPKVTK